MEGALTLKWVIEILGVSTIGMLGSILLQWLGRRRSKREEARADAEAERQRLLTEAQVKTEKAKEEDTLSGAALKMYNSVRDDLEKLRRDFLAYQTESMSTIRKLTEQNYELEKKQNELLEENHRWAEKHRRLEIDNQELKTKNTQLEAAIGSLQAELTQYKKENGHATNTGGNTAAPADPGKPGSSPKRRRPHTHP